MLRAIFSFLTGGVLDRVLRTVEHKITAQTDREKLKSDLIREYYKTRADFMRAGGFYLMLLFAVPLAFWWSAVLVYSVFWCMACGYPQEWSIAALPPPLDQWAGAIIIAIFGVIGISRFK